VVGFRRLVRDPDQHLAGRLLVVPASFDRREFRWLIAVDVIAVEVSEHELSRQEDGRKVQAHAEHDTRLGRKDPAQQVPCPGRGSGPDIRHNTLQFVPNWNAMTIPETTPSPKAMPKIFSQNSKISR